MNYAIIILFFIAVSFAVASAAPYVPTRKKDVERFLALAEIKAGENVYDLGCGGGRILSAAAGAGANAAGCEMSFFNYLFCKIFCREAKVYFGSCFKADLRNADVIYMFLMPKAVNRMGEILKKQLRPGSRVITYVWPIEGWKPVKVDEFPGRSKMYLYKI